MALDNIFDTLLCEKELVVMTSDDKCVIGRNDAECLTKLNRQRVSKLEYDTEHGKIIEVKLDTELSDVYELASDQAYISIFVGNDIEASLVTIKDRSDKFTSTVDTDFVLSEFDKDIKSVGEDAVRKFLENLSTEILIRLYTYAIYMDNIFKEGKIQHEA